jgi:hypothetical protein
MPARVARAKRERVEEAIQRHLDEADELIRLLDALEGDSDMEGPDSDLEPNTGCELYVPGIGNVDDIDIAWTENPGKGGHMPFDDEDAEPSLAHTNAIDQRRAMKGGDGWSGQRDLEAEHDGREPSLGAREWNGNALAQSVDQERWATGRRDDREGGDDDDANIAAPTSDTQGLIGADDRALSVMQWRNDFAGVNRS